MAGRNPGRRRPARVRVVYAAPQRQETVDLEITPGMSVAEAVARSGLSGRFSELAQRPLTCAIYGQIAPLTREVRDGDRVEILRPLLIDPKENRRQAAVRAKARAKSADR
ncbi:MAG: RnfH family protein [Steroidobacter sp.]